MNTSQGPSASRGEIRPEQQVKGYKVAFIVDTAIGSLMLLLSVAGSILESVFPTLKGGIAWGFTVTAIVCLFIASLCYSKYLHLKQ